MKGYLYIRFIIGRNIILTPDEFKQIEAIQKQIDDEREKRPRKKRQKTQKTLLEAIRSTIMKKTYRGIWVMVRTSKFMP